MLKYLTAGESHGEAIIAILEGMVSGLKVSSSVINRELKRRMQGYGRGERMGLEKDAVNIISGLKNGATLGSPIAMVVNNKDFSISSLNALSSPRPGHADLAGALKYGHKDLRNILERASARETVARVSVGTVCKILLMEFGIDILSHVVMIGGVEAHTKDLTFDELRTLAEKSPARCADEAATKLMCEEIDNAKDAGDTLGGAFEILVKNVPPGLGSHVQWDRKLDGNLARSLMSIQAIKGVSVGLGAIAARRRGSQCHDEIIYIRERGFSRKTNNAGGIEGGISNGEEIVLRAYMKPIATLKRPLRSVDIKTKKQAKAEVERADITAVPAAGVIGEAVTAFEIANAMCVKFGGDSLSEMKRNFEGYLEQVKEF
ncbi:MAG: chorismate synthase [Candidatus Omnitrophica bacterium]|nr:chorismate synthase [Candidatus Omnitrophota bacterium]